MKNVNKEDVMSKAMMAYVANDHYYYPSAGMSVTARRRSQSVRPLRQYRMENRSLF